MFEIVLCILFEEKTLARPRKMESSRNLFMPIFTADAVIVKEY